MASLLPISVLGEGGGRHIQLLPCSLATEPSGPVTLLGCCAHSRRLYMRVCM
jgi:hypothetical protein